ncbi:LOW QUALITY PROTEIN: hypothetical protein OSB04_029408 [Centaurea solstitialis]|uniref:Integrase catalytic domain-containing protein n=1 Tax=Centaurea solstitialis TaxID=347529 RepID=A0AA38VYS1_9ASTR|nr:LOW QUALITY PROTEIN: hypothetical protein OSB04_029408 [Centaurea solstitialis]
MDKSDKSGDKSSNVDDKSGDKFFPHPDLIPATTRLTDNKLNGSNFFEWSKTVRLYIRGMGMASHLTSDPPTDNNQDPWLQQDAHLFVQIINSIEPSVSSLVTHCEYVKELMDYLNFMFSGQSNISRIYDTCKSFHRGEQQDRSLTTYTMEFKKMYEEMNALLPLSTDMKAMEQIAVISYLTGLRPEFDHIRSQFLNESVIPSLQDAFARVLRNEKFQSAPLPDRPSLVKEDTATAFEGDTVEVIEVALGEVTTIDQLTHEDLTQTPVMLNATTAMKWVIQSLTIRNGWLEIKGSRPPTLVTKDENDPIAASAETGNSGKCLASSSSKWVIDSGASDHMTGNSNLLSDFIKPASPQPKSQQLMDLYPKQLAQAQSNYHHLSHYPQSLVYQTFALTCYLKITRHLKCIVEFFPDHYVFQDLQTKRIIGKGRESDGLYIFEQRRPYSLASFSFNSSPFKVQCRLGHPSLRSLKKLCPEFSHLMSLQCESCQFVKHQRVHLSPRVNKRVVSPFQLVHSNVWGPCPVTSKTGFRYFVTFVDDYSRVTWLYLMKNQSEVFNHLCSFHSKIKTQFQTSIKTLRSDNAKEYLSQSVQSYMLQQGIIHESSCVDTPAQNGVAERKNHHLLEVARALLFQISVPKSF